MTKREELDAAAKGEGCLGRSQDDEPVFVLVARDILAAKLVRLWADQYNELLLLQRGALTMPQAKKYREALDLAARMDAWRTAHGGGKVPD
jgi:hypothetical protein